MKKTFSIILSAILILGSCDTYTGEGAASGAYFGSTIGGIIGGLSGGWRGHDSGSLIGMAGGAIIGAVVGAKADKKVSQVQQSGFDPNNGGNDIIIMEGEGQQPGQMPAGEYPTAPATANNSERSLNAETIVAIEMQNIRFNDKDGDGEIAAGEECKMSFEIMNRGNCPVHNILPVIKETTGNKHIKISQNVLVETIMPGRGVRYTAMVNAGKRLKDGEAIIHLNIMHDGKPVAGQERNIHIVTKR